MKSSILEELENDSSLAFTPDDVIFSYSDYFKPCDLPSDATSSSSSNSSSTSAQGQYELPTLHAEDELLNSLCSPLAFLQNPNEDNSTLSTVCLNDISKGDDFLNQHLDDFIEESCKSFFFSDSTLDSCYSVLGVDLDLSSNVVTPDTTTDDDHIENLESWIIESVDNLVYKDLLVDSLFDVGTADVVRDVDNVVLDSTEIVGAQLEPADTLEILSMFPHITNEKNIKRRSLLYENTAAVKSGSSSDDQRSIKRNYALLTHDYTNKKCEDEKYFPCSIVNCDKVYSKSSHLKAHLKRHSGEKPFICNWQNCTWKFSRSDELARHKRSHLGIKPYKCELCERAFARSDHLSKHNKVHKKKMAQYGNYHIKRRVRMNQSRYYNKHS